MWKYILICIAMLTSSFAWGAEKLKKKQEREAEKIRTASSTTIRQFHEVLGELFTEFSYDVRSGRLKGLKNLSIRRISVSDALPKSYQSYLRMLITERIRENADIRMIKCLPCVSRTSRLLNGKVVITSPLTNIGELRTASERLGIENYMDAMLVYHSTHMVLAFQIFKAKTNELLWSRTYNSETIRSRFQKLAVDYEQVVKSRESDSYEPEFRFLFGFGGASIPNVGGTAEDGSMLEFELRASEKFNNRLSEFGLVLSTYLTLSKIVKDYPNASATTSSTDETTSIPDPDLETAPTPEPFSAAINLGGFYSQNFLGSIESYDSIRHGINGGAGLLLASGYLAPTIRIGWDIFFGRRFAVNATGLFISPSSVLIDNERIETKGGLGGQILMSVNF